jgi:hypothetical protein
MDPMHGWINGLLTFQRTTEPIIRDLQARVTHIEEAIGPAESRVRGLGARLRVLEERLEPPGAGAGAGAAPSLLQRLVSRLPPPPSRIPAPGGAAAAAAPRRIDGGIRRRRTRRRHH